MTRDLTPEEFARIKQEVQDKIAADNPDITPEKFKELYQPMLMKAAELAASTPEKASGGVVERFIKGGWRGTIGGMVDLAKTVTSLTPEVRNPIPILKDAASQALQGNFGQAYSRAYDILPGVPEAKQQLSAAGSSLKSAAGNVAAGAPMATLADLGRASAQATSAVPVVGPLAAGIVGNQVGQFQEAAELAKQGEYNRAAGYVAGGLIPLAGPALTAAGERGRGGDVAGMLGEAAAVFAPTKLPKNVNLPGILRNRDPDAAANVAWAMAQRTPSGKPLPVDVGTASGSEWVKGIQRLGTENIVGNLPTLMQRALQKQTYKEFAGNLAEKATGLTEKVSKIGAGQRALGDVTTTRNQLRTQGKAAFSDADMLRNMQDPEWVPTPETLTPERVTRMQNSLGGYTPSIEEIQGLRRISQEMKNYGYESHTWSDVEKAGEANTEAGLRLTPGHAGAEVFDDIKKYMPWEQQPGSTATGPTMTRAEAIRSIDNAIATGRFTNAARGALEVVKRRGQAPYSVSHPLLPPSAGELPPTLVQMPVDAKRGKDLIRAEYEAEKRIRQQTGETDRAWSRLVRFMEGPDTVPLEDLDRVASGFKTAARGGQAVVDPQVLKDPAQRMAHKALGVIEPLIEGKAKEVPGLLDALQEGRGAWREMFQVDEVRQTLKNQKSAAARFLKLTGPQGFEMLEEVRNVAPASVPYLAKAKLDQLNQLAFNGRKGTGPQRALTEFEKMEPQTLEILFPDKKHRTDLHELYKIMAARAENVNPSGTGTLVAKGAELGTLGTSAYYLLSGAGAGLPWVAPIMSTITGAMGVAGHSPQVARLLVQGTKIPVRNQAALASWGQSLSKAVEEAQRSLAPEEEAPSP